MTINRDLRRAAGQLDRADFMKEIIGYTEDSVAKARKLATDAKNQPFPDIKAPCPVCGATSLRQTDATYECRTVDCSFKANKHIAGHLLTEDEAAQLFTHRFVGPLTGFRSKFNKPFDAGLGLDDKFKIQFVFDQDERDGHIELNDEHRIGEATLTDGRAIEVFETEKYYHLPALATAKEPAGIRIGRAILKRDLDREQFFKLLATGKTDLLRGFISNRTKRPFEAHLTFNPADGKIGFEFPPRPDRPNANRPAQASGDAPAKRAAPATQSGRKTSAKPTRKAAKKTTKKAAKKAPKRTEA